MNDTPLLNDVTGVIRRFLCKLHGITNDHNYEPMFHVLFNDSTENEKEPSQQKVKGQDMVNLVWVMLEELCNILEASGKFPRRMKQWMDFVRPTRDQNVQTDMSHELTDSRHVQITCTNDEFNRRINAFIKRKRAQADAFNRREFCKLPNDEDDDDDQKDDSTCARTDAVFVPRQSKKSLVRIERVYNSVSAKEKSPLRMERLKNWPPTHPSNTLPFSNVPHDIKERLQSLHTVLVPNKRIGQYSDVYTQLRGLEQRLLYLETLSPEYFDMNRRKMLTESKRTFYGSTSEPVVFDTVEDENTNEQQDNLCLLEHRIDELKTRLVERAKRMKKE